MSEDGEGGDPSFTVGPDGDRNYFSDEALRKDGIKPESVNVSDEEMADIDRQFGDEPKGEKGSVFSRIFNRGRSNEAPTAPINNDPNYEARIAQAERNQRAYYEKHKDEFSSPLSADNSEPDFIAELDRKQKEANARVEAITGNSEHFKDLQRLNRSFIPSAEKIYEEMKKNRPKGMENIDTDDVLEMRAAAQHQDLVARAEGKKKLPWVSREHQEYAEKVKNPTQFQVTTDNSVSPILPEFPGKERKVEGTPAPIPFQEIKGPANEWRPSGPRNDDFLPIEQPIPLTTPEATRPVVEKDKALPERYKKIQGTGNFPERYQVEFDDIDGPVDVTIESAHSIDPRDRMRVEIEENGNKRKYPILESVFVQKRGVNQEVREFIQTARGEWFTARRNSRGGFIEPYKIYQPTDSFVKLIEPVMQDGNTNSQVVEAPSRIRPPKAA